MSKPLPSVRQIIEGWALYTTNTSPPRAMPFNGSPNDGIMRADLHPWCAQVVREVIAKATAGKDAGVVTSLLLHVYFRGEPVESFWLTDLATRNAVALMLERIEARIKDHRHVVPIPALIDKVYFGAPL